MSFFDSLMTGLGKVAEFAGQAFLANEWKDTLQKEGIQMLQVKIRNFLRSASEEDKGNMQKTLEAQLTSSSLALADRKAFSQVHEIYIDQRG